MVPSSMHGYVEWVDSAHVGVRMAELYPDAGSSGQDSGIAEAKHALNASSKPS